MKRILYAALIMLFSLSFATLAEAQTQLYNQSDKDIALMYDGDVIPVPANTALFWPEAPSGQFIAYIYQRMPGVIDTDARIVKKLGFMTLENENGVIIFDRFQQSLPAVVTNYKDIEVVVEYNNLSVFIQSGATAVLPDIFITPTGQATLLISECQGNLINPAQPLVLSFATSIDCLRAEIR